VDPYYLTYKAETIGYIPQVILAGRRINDGMGKFIAQKTIKKMICAGQTIKGCVVTVLGLTFKEDCPDLRNSKVMDIIRELQDYGIEVQVHDPVVDSVEAAHEYGIALTPMDKLKPAAAVIVAVAHKSFRELALPELRRLMGAPAVLIDVKAIFDPVLLKNSGVAVWRL